VVQVVSYLTSVVCCVTGSFLSDLFSMMKTVDCAVTLNTNHRAESQCIIDNAIRITKKLCPVANAKRHFNIIELLEIDESLSNGWLPFFMFHFFSLLCY